MAPLDLYSTSFLDAWPMPFKKINEHLRKKRVQRHLQNLRGEKETAGIFKSFFLLAKSA